MVIHGFLGSLLHLFLLSDRMEAEKKTNSPSTAHVVRAHNRKRATDFIILQRKHRTFSHISYMGIWGKICGILCAAGVEMSIFEMYTFEHNNKWHFRHLQWHVSMCAIP